MSVEALGATTSGSRAAEVIFEPYRVGRASGAAQYRNGPLGTDYDTAMQLAEKVLLPAFDSSRNGGEDSNPVDIGVRIGTGCFTSTGERGRLYTRFWGPNWQATTKYRFRR